MVAHSLPEKIRDLRNMGYEVLPIREELRNNLMTKIRNDETVFPGIVGFEETVLPQVENAILAGQDIILLGERGQAKSRLVRSLVNLLDESVPIIAGCEINDNPLNPVCKSCRDKIADTGDETTLEWISRERRYSEKLATPDISIADLIGEIDPIKVAEGLHLSDELAIHYGLVPRTNRGIFSINELPDLAERIQVGLFNLMEERDVQIKGYRLSLPLDVYVVATANPEDYTNRGRIVTPLKDRYGAQIHTHYPRFVEQEISIMDQERAKFPDEANLLVPDFMKQIIGQVTVQARQSNEINQRSGVSVRVSIANYETLLSNAVRRSIRQGDQVACPRISDIPYILASFGGKIELETFEEGRETKVMEDLIRRATLKVHGEYFDNQDLEDIVVSFGEGTKVETGSEKSARGYLAFLEEINGLSAAVGRLTSDNHPEVVASGIEFVLEGLHLNRRLNCQKTGTGFRYHS